MRAALVFLTLAALAPAQDAGIHWVKSRAEARARSAAEGRPVILYFTFDT